MYQGESIQESSSAIGLIHDLCPPLASPVLSPASGRGIYSIILVLYKDFMEIRFDVMDLEFYLACCFQQTL